MNPAPQGPRRRQVLAGAAGMLAAALLAACQGRPRPEPPGGPASTTPAPTPTPTPTSASPTPTPAVPVEVMVGEMLMLGFRGTTLTPDNPVVADLRDRHVGGVVLFSRDLPTGGDRNVTSPDQLAALCADLQEAAGTRLLIATDQEGGRVARLGPRHGFPATRSAAELGAAGDPAATREAAYQLARTLTPAGINFNHAP
ncbi:glycoside hydrolase family 3 N-terminal domain-containing protein, partial [Georgenia sp.]